MFKKYIYLPIAVLLLITIFCLFSKGNEYFTYATLNTPLTINTGMGGQEKETDLEKMWDQHIRQYGQAYDSMFSQCHYYSKNKSLFVALFAKGCAEMKVMVPQQPAQHPHVTQILKRVCQIMSAHRK